ncbi:hypothetical protein Pden_3827 [Paracoccus denitrificans PD1222]|uniref:Uncharacterized protein n=1 Tax=Paracoccus denitrificans (strain Pd 1222) TaxID=318586 RepID=A1B8P9_PARDP|nr:hypothetical protein Pden_3827 [Paracoccus denitrificans PD1222]
MECQLLRRFSFAQRSSRKTAGHLRHNLLICMLPHCTNAGHHFVDFVQFSEEVVGDPGIEPGMGLPGGVTVRCRTLQHVARRTLSA